MPVIRSGFGCLLIVAASLQAQSLTPTWPIREAPANLRYAVARGDLTIASMQDALTRELRESLATRGPAVTADSAHVDVFAVVHRVAREDGIAAGLTGDRLRNPTNAPRAWAAPLVREHAGRRARDVDGFVVDLGTRVGILRPIAHRAVCASCHGPADAIAPGVTAAVKERYPVDRATGFREGEIRGWFWAEVPKMPR
jgi:hypothetical protein